MRKILSDRHLCKNVCAVARKTCNSYSLFAAIDLRRFPDIAPNRLKTLMLARWHHPWNTGSRDDEPISSDLSPRAAAHVRAVHCAAPGRLLPGGQAHFPIGG